MSKTTINEIGKDGLVKSLGAGVLRWTGTRCPAWESRSPLSTWQTEPFLVCQQCQISVEFLAADDRYSSEDVNKFLQEFRDHVLENSEHGYHLPICGQLATGQKLRP
jgi:hypothetical protein